MERILSLLSKIFGSVIFPLSSSGDSAIHRCRLKFAQQEACRRICAGMMLATALLASLWMREAQAGPTITLTYRGTVETLPATAVLQFEDLRLPANYPPFGFYYSTGGRLCWQRVAPLSGRIYVSGYISTPTEFYNLADGTVNDISDWGYLTIVPTVGSSFLGRVDLPSDANLVYMDQFALTANPLGPGNPTTYYFNFDVVATPTISPNGGSFPGPVQVTLACATAGATIYYTTNGTTPTTGSALYSAPFTLAASATVKAMGVKFGLTDFSAGASATFTVTPGAPPLLTITRSGNGVILSWPLSAQGYVLESAGTLTGPNQWSAVVDTPTTNGLSLQVTNPVSGNAKFYRLKK